MPAKAGIQSQGFDMKLDSRFRGNDKDREADIFFTDLQNNGNLPFRLMKLTGPPVTDSPTSDEPPAETRETVRSARLARKIARNEWRQSCFELISAGHSYAEVAKALLVSERTVRRDVARVIDERRLDAPERYIHMQVDRLRRALRTADGQVERGDMKAVAPLIKLIGALDRYHGLDARYRHEPRLAALPPAAAAPLALAPPAENLAKVSESDMQTLEKV